MRRRLEGAIAAALVALVAWAVPPVARAELDSGVIRLAQPTPTAEPNAPATSGINCINPIAPAREIAFGSKADSACMTE